MQQPSVISKNVASRDWLFMFFMTRSKYLFSNDSEKSRVAAP
jgi:hypothetical protein